MIDKKNYLVNKKILVEIIARTRIKAHLRAPSFYYSPGLKLRVYGNLIVLKQFKGFGINLNAQHTNGMTPFDLSMYGYLMVDFIIS